MKLNRLLVHFFCISLCFTCAKDQEITPRNYPRVKTMPVSNITAEGALFKGEITFVNQETIAEHGFLWSSDTEPSLFNSEIINLGPVSSTGTFNSHVERSLIAGKRYFMRAYLKTGNKLVLGNLFSFTSLGSKAPRIRDFQPSSGFVMDTIRIRGENFSNLARNVKVAFGNDTTSVLSASDTLLAVLVPPALASEQSVISVAVAGNAGLASEKFKLLPPAILAISSNIVAPGDTLIISGNNFFPDLHHLQVWLNSEPCSIVSHTQSEIKIIVPFFRPTSDQTSLKVISSNLSVVYNDKITYLKPAISSLEADDEIVIGDTLRLNGTHLSFHEITINLNGRVVYPLHIDPNYIDFIIPLDVYSSSNVVQVTFGQNVVDFETTIMLAPPVISTITPSVATFNEEIVITGKNFHPLPEYNDITIAGETTKAISATATSITLKVPSTIGDCASGNLCNTLQLNVLGQFVTGDELFALRVPVIESLQPSEVTNGNLLTVHGKYFNPNNTAFNRSVISEKNVLPVSAGSETLVFNADQLNETPLISSKKTTTIKVSNSNEYPLTLNFQGPYTQKAKFPGVRRTQLSMATVGNNEYMGLGFAADGTSLSDFYEYNAVEDTWTQLADFPGGGRTYAVAFALGDFVYMGMGLVSTADQYYAATDMWRYNVTSGIWQQISDFPGMPKYNAFVFVAGDKAFIGGGSRVPLGAAPDLWTFDGSTWQQKNDVPESNDFSASSFVKDELIAYVFFRKKLYEYNVTMDSWSHVNDFSSSSQLDSFTGAMVNGTGYLWSIFWPSTVMVKYIPSSNSWQYQEIPVPLFRPNTFVIKNKFYALFGYMSLNIGSISEPNYNVWEFDYTKYPY